MIDTLDLNVPISFSPEARDRIERDRINKGVYIIECKGRFKIGMSTNIRKRADSLQTPWPSNLIAIKESNQPLLHEKEIHRIYSTKRVYGEWFVFSKEELNKLIKEHNFTQISEPTDFDHETIKVLQDALLDVEIIKKEKEALDQNIRDIVESLVEQEIYKSQARDILIDDLVSFLNTQKTGILMPENHKRNIMETAYIAARAESLGKNFKERFSKLKQ